MDQPSVTELARLIAGWYLRPGMVGADLTAGNGRDTLFLAQRCARVYAFDISPEAIANTRARITGMTNVILIQDSHEMAGEYIREPLDFAIFNFGYRPGGDHALTTETAASLKAVQAVLDLLRPGGLAILGFYPHPEGRRERATITEWLKSTPHLVSFYQTERPGAPGLCLITKRSAGSR